MDSYITNGKGNRVKIPEPEHGCRPLGTKAATQIKNPMNGQTFLHSATYIQKTHAFGVLDSAQL